MSRGGAVYYLTYDHGMSPIAHSVWRMTLRPIALLAAVPSFSLIGFSQYSKSKLTGPPAWSILIMSLGMPDPAPLRENCFFYQGVLYIPI